MTPYAIAYSVVSILGDALDPEEYQAYRDAFEAFDWSSSGRISSGSLQVDGRDAQSL